MNVLKNFKTSSIYYDYLLRYIEHVLVCCAFVSRFTSVPSPYKRNKRRVPLSYSTRLSLLEARLVVALVRHFVYASQAAFTHEFFPVVGKLFRKFTKLENLRSRFLLPAYLERSVRTKKLLKNKKEIFVGFRDILDDHNFKTSFIPFLFLLKVLDAPLKNSWKIV